MRQLGLIGYPLSHSFSKRYFSEKFEREGILGYSYDLFPLERIEDIRGLLDEHPDLVGLNVTIPYKTAVIPYLDAIDDEARAVGAVNCIRIEGGKLKGYNTDVYGFERTMRRFIDCPTNGIAAMILGTGGAAKAVKYVLDKLEMVYIQVGRKEEKGVFSYERITGSLVEDFRLIINTTPLGMFPHVDGFPPLPYGSVGHFHCFYDLVYNPEETAFMRLGKARGARVMNGLGMLHLQADRAWEIWNAHGSKNADLTDWG